MAKKVAPDLIAEIAEFLQKNWKQNIRRQCFASGLYHDSVMVLYDGLESEVYIEEKMYPNGATTIEVAGWLEFGTVKMMPRPHVLPAVFKTHNQIPKIIESYGFEARDL
jgi:hypothetical protein